MLKAQVQATSPRCFRTKKENQTITKYLSTSVERPAQQFEFRTSPITKAEKWESDEPLP